jgi:hypothetical protein
MTKLSFFDVEYAGKRKRARGEKILEEMDRAVPWDAFLALIEPLHPKAGNGRRPFVFKAMLRIHLMQNWVATVTRLWRRRSTQSRPCPALPACLRHAAACPTRR